MKPLRYQSKITLMINPLVDAKMEALVKSTNKELSWHGFIERINDNTFYMYDITMFPQINTGVTSTTDDDEYANWCIKMMERDDYENMRLHGHSHVRMGVHPSGTDMQYRGAMVKNLNKENGWYFFIILNQLDDMNIELYDYQTGMIYDEDDIEVYPGEPTYADECNDWVNESMNTYVKEEKITCSITSKVKNSSTPKKFVDLFTSSDVELSEEQLQNIYADWE